MAKPILLIGVDPDMNAAAGKQIIEQLRGQFPEYTIAVVGGMRYATVIDGDEYEPDPGPITLEPEYRRG